MNNRDVRQGEIYMANLDGIGNEECGFRPCICLSCNNLTKNRNNVIIAPITSSKTKKEMMNHYVLLKEKYPFFQYEQNTILLECIRDISKIRLERIMGFVDRKDLKEIIKKINYNFVEFHR